MPYFLLVCAVVSLMLLGCSSLEERQDRAQGVLDQAKSLTNQLAETASGAVQKMQATALEVEERADKIQGGVEKVVDATKELKEGTEEVREAVQMK